ncbi:MAG: hypothetical protein Q9184_007013 [Pyrenodesmia sp. 2 TL-2023]
MMRSRRTPREDAEDPLSDGALAESQLQLELSDAASQHSSIDSASTYYSSSSFSSLPSPLAEPASYPFLTRLRNACFAPLYWLRSRYSHSPGYRHRLIHDLSVIIFIIFFAPVLIPFIAIYLVVYLFLYTPQKYLINSLPLRLQQSTRKRLRQAAILTTVLAALALLARSNDGKPPKWIDFQDDFLLQFEETITSSCGKAGRRLHHLHARPFFPTSATSNTKTSPPCVPTLCPNTLSFLTSPKNFYSVLGLPDPSPIRPPTPRSEITAAYNALIKFYHPDKILTHHLPPEISAYIFAVIRAAGKTLLNDKRRENYDRNFLTGAMGRRIKEAERKRIEMVGDVDKLDLMEGGEPSGWGFWHSPVVDRGRKRRRWGRRARGEVYALQGTADADEKEGWTPPPYSNEKPSPLVDLLAQWCEWWWSRCFADLGTRVWGVLVGVAHALGLEPEEWEFEWGPRPRGVLDWRWVVRGKDSRWV